MPRHLSRPSAPDPTGDQYGAGAERLGHRIRRGGSAPAAARTATPRGSPAAARPEPVPPGQRPPGHGVVVDVDQQEPVGVLLTGPSGAAPDRSPGEVGAATPPAGPRVTWVSTTSRRVGGRTERCRISQHPADLGMRRLGDLIGVRRLGNLLGGYGPGVRGPGSPPRPAWPRRPHRSRRPQAARSVTGAPRVACDGHAGQLRQRLNEHRRRAASGGESPARKTQEPGPLDREQSRSRRGGPERHRPQHQRADREHGLSRRGERLKPDRVAADRAEPDPQPVRAGGVHGHVRPAERQPGRRVTLAGPELSSVQRRVDQERDARRTGTPHAAGRRRGPPRRTGRHRAARPPAGPGTPVRTPGRMSRRPA